MRHVYLIVLLITGSLNPLLSQQQLLKNYTVNDGLVSNSIRRIFQDSKGFLWIATWEGLSKYDGHVFTNYSTLNGLSHNLVNDFCELKDGRLYVALNNGSIDIISDNQVIHKDSLSKTVVNHFIHSQGHPIIATTDLKGLQEFTDGRLIRPRQSSSPSTYIDLQWLNDSVFIAVSDSAIGAFNKKYELLTELRDLYIFAGSKIYQDSKKRIWVATSKGLKLLAESPGQNHPIRFTTLPAPFNIPALQQRRIYDILEDAEGILWFGTSAGLVKINPDGTYQFINTKDGLTSNIITSIFQDREKNIWFGTEIGLSKLVTRSGIRLYTVEDGVFKNDNLFVLYPFKKNYFLVSTFNGIKLFDKRTGIFTPIANGLNQVYYYVIPNTSPPLLVGLKNIAKFDTGSFKYSDTFSLPSTSISRVVNDKAGNLFYTNLEHLVLSTGKTFQEILRYRISSLLIDKAGSLWAATWQNGVFRIRYNIIDKKFNILNNVHFLPAENVRSLYEDSKGNIWVGTRYNGVYQFKNDGRDSFFVSNYNQSKGLSSNFIKAIREDSNGNIWIAFYQGLDKLISTDTGFSVFNFSRINNYYAGMIGMETDENNSIWLATGEGIAHITDGEMEKLPPSQVYITNVSSLNLNFPLHHDELHLTYRQNQLQFKFSSPSFINEKQVVYSYRLSGSSDAEWSVPSNQNIVSYASLKPGKYLFEVRNKGWNDTWGKSTSFEFIISPPFWQSWWFILIISVGCALIVLWIIKRRIKSIRHESEMKQKIAGTEMMALRAQMNPHFIFNCLNSIDNLIQTDQKEKATDYLAKFAQLIRAILENSKNNTIPCWKDLEALELYLEMEKLRWDHKISCTLTIDSQIQQGDYKVPPMIVQPFIENAIHHGLLNKTSGDKKLDIEVHLEENNIKYTITDNGVGRQKAQEYKKINRPSQLSFGMQITKDRINLFNQNHNGSVKITDLYNAQHLPEGTKVEVWLTTQPTTT